MSALLSISGLRVGFRRGKEIREVVHGVDLAIDADETLALVGESGSGKTVTAQSILRLLPESLVAYPAGEIAFKGRNTLGMTESELRAVRGDEIGMVFQEPMSSLNPLHTVEKQLGETLFLHRGLSAAAARPVSLDWLRRVGLASPEKKLGSYPHQLSGGERQRVMIAMALANEPSLLIADEPTTALDVTIQAQILDLLKELQAELGMAVLFITHNLEIVRRIATRVAVMHDGLIVETRGTSAIFALPEHPYTKSLLDAEPKSESPEPDPARPLLLEARELKVWFPVQRGWLRKTSDYVKAVDGVDLTLRRGETLGMAGESGSGKTTLGKALLRLTTSKGAILFEGERVDGLGAEKLRLLRRRMQIIFQDPFGSLNPRMTVEDIIGEGLEVARHEGRGRARGVHTRHDARRRPRPRAEAALSARVFRGAAPAHRHREGPGAPPLAARPRRAHLLARPDHPIPGDRAAEGASVEVRSELHLHQPRPQGAQGPLPRARDHEGRQNRRVGAGRADLRGSPAPLHQGAPDYRLRALVKSLGLSIATL